MFEKGAMPAAQAEKMLQLLLTKAAQPDAAPANVRAWVHGV